MKKYINPSVKFVALANEAIMAAASTKIHNDVTVDGSQALGKEALPAATSVWDE